MSATKKVALGLLCLASSCLAPISPATAAVPVWKLVGIPLPTHFVPGADARLLYVAANIGAEDAGATTTLQIELPTGVKPISAQPIVNDAGSAEPSCSEPPTQTITCTVDGPIAPGQQLQVTVFVEVDPLLPKGTLASKASIGGGGALMHSIEPAIEIDSQIAPFDFLEQDAGGPELLLTDEDGFPASAAGSHPYQLTASLGFPTEEPGVLSSTGHPKDIIVDLPRGLIVNPTATPVLCTEAQLTSLPGCPDASQVGTATVITLEAALKAAPSALYNMVPPPGTAAQLGFEALQAGVYVHLAGSVRSDGDYGLTSTTPDSLAITLHPIFGARADLWGDPSDPVHDRARGGCLFTKAFCSVKPTKTALITTPSDCPGKPTTTRFSANNWEQPGSFVEGAYENSSLDGTPVSVDGCNELDFKPQIELSTSTNLTDSPAGLEFNLHQPQETGYVGRSTANLKDATVTFPEGLVVNPSAAQGQQACSSAQIGLLTGVGQTPINFSKTPAQCPGAAKIGTVEVETPLLAQVDESKTQVLRDPEGDPIPRPLIGDVYLARPFDNPFGSLLAIYFDVEDSLSGTVAKFAIKLTADPVTGQLTNGLIESPELPIEDVRVKTFIGARAALRTPPTCVAHTAAAHLVPWSAPQGGPVTATDSFSLIGTPDGSPCPPTPAAAFHHPGFVAGTVDPQAGAFSPFLLRVSRQDGSAPIAGFEATLPKGLTAKLAGIPYCPEAQIAQAQSRNRPEEGRIEQVSPSCPAASEVGSVDVAAGAGPTPLHTQGRVYLAGPYKGAPLSFVIITPAIAGPFDLGAVVLRTAAYFNPETAIVRAVSDPLPVILEGIPLDLREAVVKMDRPQFTLNPSSCEPMAVNATATSVFAQPAALSEYFQLAGCDSLRFKPKVDIRLKGSTKRTGHPALKAVATFRPGDANTARAAVTLPPSAFLDQAHIGTVCTRVQFAAHHCPQRSIYGFAKATTPLLDKGLEGPVYLRSSNHELPDLVVALAGQVEVVLAGRVDSINGGIRNTFEAAPDAPVTRFVLDMQGGKKGLLQNSENLCRKKSYATVQLRAHNGRIHNFKALVRNDCKRKKAKGKKGRGKSGGP